MNKELHQESTDLLNTGRNLTNYTKAFLILKRFKALIGLVGIHNFDEDFRHYYRSVEGVETYHPGTAENDAHLTLINRELGLMLPELELYLRDKTDEQVL